MAITAPTLPDDVDSLKAALLEALARAADSAVLIAHQQLQSFRPAKAAYRYFEI